MEKVMTSLAIVMIMICGLVYGADISGMTYSVDADRNSASAIYSDCEIGLYGTPGYEATPFDTGIDLVEGDTVTISAEGIWGNASWLTFGVEGNRYENIAYGYPGAGLPVAAFIGKVGNGEWFYAGTDKDWIEDTGGRLRFAFNDTDYGNNWGTARVTVSIKSIHPTAEKSAVSDCGWIEAELDLWKDGYSVLETETKKLRNDLDDLSSEMEVLGRDFVGLLEFIKIPPGVRKRTYFEPQSEIVKEIKKALLPELGYGKYRNN